MADGAIATWTPTSGSADAKSARESPDKERPASGSAKKARGASSNSEIENEPAPQLIVDAPPRHLLDKGIVWIQWWAENVHIAPVFGKAAVNATPRVGHLHVQVDDLPWLWAESSDVNTIDLAGMPPGPHRIRIDLVNSNHEVFRGQSKTLTFTIPAGISPSHTH
jgi:hypothetical protein